MQNVIDGDLCEVFNSMEPSKQKSIAEELEDRSSNEVSKLFIKCKDILNMLHNHAKRKESCPQIDYPSVSKMLSDFFFLYFS